MITDKRAEELIKKYYDKILRYSMAISKNNREDALEITQEVFLVFSKKYKSMNDDNIENWLLNVSRKKALEYYRKTQNDRMVISLEDSFTSAEDILSTLTKYYSVSDADIKMTIEAILRMLTEEEYTLFVKKFIEEKSQKEIAEELGVAVSTISTRTSRLRKKIETLGFFCFSFVGQIIIKNFF